MERREQYDPEDIESLLQERSFDELLEEERAYVLRHLSGREEYEQMRALLQHVREDDRRHRPIEADDHVRANVMQAFRAQQQPQWRVWLNSIGAIFMPGEGFAIWRPALALGTIVLLFGLGFWLINGPLAGPTNQELAEVRRQKGEEPLPVNKPQIEDTSYTLRHEGSATANTAVKEEMDAVVTYQRPATVHVNTGPETSRSLEKAELTEDMTKDANAAAELQVAEATTIADDADLYAPASPGHIVTENEMIRNQSLANASGKVAVAPATSHTKSIESASGLVNSSSRSVADDPEVLELLSAGW